MLDFLRRGVKSWVAKVLLGMLILSFAVWGLNDIFTGSSNPKVAHVGDVDVEARRFAVQIQRQRNALSQQQGALVSYADMRANGIDRAVLAGLVRDAAFNAELQSLGIAIPDQTVADEIRANAAFQDGQGQFSQYLYADRIAQTGYDPAEFEALTRQVLGQQIMRAAVGAGATYVPDAVEEIAKYESAERGFEYISVPGDPEADPGTPTESDLASFFADNEDRFREPERRWVRIVATDLATLAQDVTVTDEEVRAAFDSRQDAFTTPERRTVEQIVFTSMTDAESARDRLAEGSATFAEIAAEQNVSLDALSLGEVGRDDLAEASAEAAFALEAPGVAGPVQGAFGPILLNVTSITLGGTTPFDDVKDAIRGVLAEERIAALVPERANMIDDIRAGGASMEDIAEQTELPLITLSGIARDFSVAEGSLPTTILDPRMMQEIMAAEEGEERDIAEMSDGSYALVMVDRIEPSRLPALDEVRDAVAAAWTEDNRLEATANALSARIEAGEDFTALAESLGATVATQPSFRRQTAPAFLTREMATEVFEAALDTVVTGRAGDEILVARITHVGGVNEAALIVRLDEITAALGNSLANDYVEYFGRALEARHGATFNPDVIESIFDQLGAQGGT